MNQQQRHIHQQWSLMEAAHRLIDAGCILLGMLIGLQYSTTMTTEWMIVAGAVTILVFFLVSGFTDLYKSWRGVTAEREFLCVFITWVVSVFILLGIGYATHYTIETSRGFLLFWIVSAPLCVAASRVAIRAVLHTLRARGMNTRKFAIVGVNQLGMQLAKNIETSPELGLKLAGFFDDRPDDRNPELPESIGARSGDISDLIVAAKDGSIDRIYIAFPMRAEERIRTVLSQLSDTTASVYIVPDFFVFELLHSRWTNINGLPAVSVFENPFYGVDGAIKRLMDTALAITALAILAVPMLIVAALIKLTSKGPVFFRQKRYGLDGREILVWKFRSMSVLEQGDQFVQATRNDPRVTAVGRVIRKTSIDELPQLFNVLEGNMSLVGPRPHATAQNEEYRSLIQGYMLRHKVKPGITGLAQVNGCRGETDTLDKMEARIRFDHRYIREWSVWMDIQIMFRTLFVLWGDRNAY
ncbi:MAG: undecaprenyl-phosphate glucose phosphotransferase [bacterium]|nr:undecaprenyl-phosphate glucose phosphotransferase [bacterium]